MAAFYSGLSPFICKASDSISNAWEVSDLSEQEQWPKHAWAWNSGWLQIKNVSGHEHVVCKRLFLNEPNGVNDGFDPLNHSLNCKKIIHIALKQILLNLYQFYPVM